MEAGFSGTLYLAPRGTVRQNWNYKGFYMRAFFSVIILLSVSAASLAQTNISKWKDYLSYMNAYKVTLGDDKVFCATDGGLFFADYKDNSLDKLNRRSGLSDMGIQTIAYHPGVDVLVVAYKNGNIDLVTQTRVFNLADILRKTSPMDKTINNIFFHGSDAYLACGFGIVVINLEKREIKDTYIIGENGSQIAVFDVQTDGQNLFAATINGIYKASLNSPNLLDYRNWSKDTTIPRASGRFSHLEQFNGEILAVYTRNEWDGDEMYILRSGQWIRGFHPATFVHDIQKTGNYLVISSREEVIIFNQYEQIIGRILNYSPENQPVIKASPRSSVISDDGTIWIADNYSGLISVKGERFEQKVPPGPLNNSIFSLTVHGQSLWVTPGGRNDAWNNQFRSPAFQEYTSDRWNYFQLDDYPQMTGFFDIVQIAVNPADPGHIFAASWGGGLLEFKNREFVKRYNNLNSPLETAIPEDPNAPYTRIGGIAFDKDNVLWVTNSQSSKGLHSLTATGEWKSFELPEVAGFQYTIGPVMVTGNQDKWIILPRGRDLYVVNKDGSRKKYLPVTSYFNNGKEEFLNRMNEVYSIAEDLNGDIWVGTSKGVAVFPNPQRVWQEGNYYAFQPGLELGDGIYHPLLETETITAIAVDGANRKWLGTKNSGLYLVSEKGDREVLHFTASDSPLLSNSITSLGMDLKTGLLFIGTDAGLISYQGDAPEGNLDFSGMYVYPNPVRETYDGPIVVRGLMKNSDIRITDIAGNLVYKARSLGNQLVWDGRNRNGRRVSTGVYLILAADQAGAQTGIVKLLFIK